MKNLSVKNKNRIKGIKPILIISAIFAYIALYFLKEYSVISMLRPSNLYSQDALVNPFGKITNEFFTVLMQISVQIALTIINFITIIFLLYFVSYVMKALISLIAIGVKELSEVKYTTSKSVYVGVAQPVSDCACLLTCKNLN